MSFNLGDEVFYTGSDSECQQWGEVVADYGAGMYEIRLESGELVDAWIDELE